MPDEEPLLPHSLDAEKGVLGSMLIAPTEVIGECVERINGEYFHQPAHAIIYNLLIEFWNNQQPADIITLTQTLRDRKQLAAVGGAAYITSLIGFTPTAANVGYYLAHLEEKHMLRGIIGACQEATTHGYSDEGETYTLLERTIARLEALKDNGRREAQAKSMREHIMGQIEAIEHLYENRGKITGLSTGFLDLDRLTDGLHPTELTVLAGRPSMGKTAFAMNIAEHVALTGKQPVAVFSLEMSAEQLARRMLCSRARVNLQKVRDGFLSERDFPNLTNAAAKLAECQIHLDDTAGLSVQAFRARARRMHRQHGIRLIIIDQTTQMRSSTKRAAESRQQEVSEISSGVKAVAKELRIPIILIAHLNRQVENRRMNRPRLSDLRESGSLEQDADTVLFIHRPEYYAEDDEAKQELHGEAELIIAKQRNGPVDDVKLTFLHEYTRFEDRAEPARAAGNLPYKD